MGFWATLAPYAAMGGASLAGSLFNYNAQKENQEYQRDMAQNMMQYRVRDLKRAGLNPVLATGAASSPMPVSTAPQIDVSGAAHTMDAAVARAIELLRAKKDIEVSESQVALNAANAAKAQTESRLMDQTYGFNEGYNPGRLEAQALENKFRSMANPIEIERMVESNVKLGYETAKAKYDAEITRLGITRQEIAIHRDRIERSAAEQGLSVRDKELVAKELAIKQKEAELQRYNRDSEIYSHVYSPSDQGLTSGSKFGLILGDALRSLFGGKR